MAEQKKSTLKVEEIPYNDTTKFLLPCFNLSLKNFEKKGFVNGFLSDVNRDKINDTDNYLYLLFKPNKEGLIDLQATIANLEEQDSDKMVYVEDYDYPGGYIVLVLKFPEKYRQDYHNFILGKYSKFSQTIKDLYKEIGATYQLLVCNKDEKAKKFNEKKYDIDLSEADEYHQIYTKKDNILNIDSFNI